MLAYVQKTLSSTEPPKFEIELRHIVVAKDAAQAEEFARLINQGGYQVGIDGVVRTAAVVLPTRALRPTEVCS